MHNYAFILPSMKSVSEMALIMHNLCDESLEKCLVVFPLPYQRLMQGLGSNGFVVFDKKWNKQTDDEYYYVESYATGWANKKTSKFQTTAISKAF